MSILQTTIPFIVILVGSGGIVFGALRFQRDEAGRIVAQQTAVLTDMRSLNDELQEALTRTRAERDDLDADVRKLTDEVRHLRAEVRRLTMEIEQR